MLSQKRFNRKTVSGVIAAAFVLTSLTACASSSQGGETAAREASEDTGRIKVCVKNETGSAFQIGYWDPYLNENNQPITERNVTVATNATQCVFSVNEQRINYSDINFYMWRDESLKTIIRVKYKYKGTDFSVVPPQMNTEEYLLFFNETERQIDWSTGSLFASYLKTPEAYTSGSAYPVNIRITSLN